MRIPLLKPTPKAHRDGLRFVLAGLPELDVVARQRALAVRVRPEDAIAQRMRQAVT